jgi:hypothetical protein
MGLTRGSAGGVSVLSKNQLNQSDANPLKLDDRIKRPDDINDVVKYPLASM